MSHVASVTDFGCPVIDGTLFLMEENEYVLPTPSRDNRNSSSFQNVVFFCVDRAVDGENKSSLISLSEAFSIFQNVV